MHSASRAALRGRPKHHQYPPYAVKAVLYEAFCQPPKLATVPDPTPPDDGVVVRVHATGLCRSDWHGWQGHDPDIATLPHVPGHELAGEVVAVGKNVTRWRGGERVTVPFVAGCGACEYCCDGETQVCPDQFQPGFHGWGSYAEYVALRYADANLLRVPEAMSSVAAASLGCRFATAQGAVAMQAGVTPDEWVAVHGCGGVGLAAVMLAASRGARPIAVDVRDEPLAKATQLGAVATINSSEVADVPDAIHDLTRGGAHKSIDAYGSRATMTNSILSLRRLGTHVQVGLLAGDQADPPVPMGRVIGWELALLGSHGLSAGAYGCLLDHVAEKRLDLESLIDRTIPLAKAPAALAALDDHRGAGASVVDLRLG